MDDGQLELGLGLGLDTGFCDSASSADGVAADPSSTAAADPPEESAPDPEADLLERLRGYGAPVERVVLTENRRTMLSWTGPRRGIVRIHSRFGGADESVIRAVADFVTLRKGARRTAAIREIRAFVQQFPPVVPEPRRRRIGLLDRPHIERLAAEFARVNDGYFDGALPVVPLLLSGRMRRRNGHFSTRPLEIVISRSLCLHAEPGEAEHTLRHEMIHLWQHVAGVPLGHGREFRQWARVLDVHPRATRGVAWKTRTG